MEKVKSHLESHKDKYMFGTLVVSAFLHATGTLALKTVLMMVVAALPWVK